MYAAAIIVIFILLLFNFAVRAKTPVRKRQIDTSGLQDVAPTKPLNADNITIHGGTNDPTHPVIRDIYSGNPLNANIQVKPIDESEDTPEDNMHSDVSIEAMKAIHDMFSSSSHTATRNDDHRVKARPVAVARNMSPSRNTLQDGYS